MQALATAAASPEVTIEPHSLKAALDPQTDAVSSGPTAVFRPPHQAAAMLPENPSPECPAGASMPQDLSTADPVKPSTASLTPGSPCSTVSPHSEEKSSAASPLVESPSCDAPEEQRETTTCYAAPSIVDEAGPETNCLPATEHSSPHDMSAVASQSSLLPALPAMGSSPHGAAAADSEEPTDPASPSASSPADGAAAESQAYPSQTLPVESLPTSTKPPKRPKAAPPVQCPVCGLQVSLAGIQEHVEMCMGRADEDEEPAEV